MEKREGRLMWKSKGGAGGDLCPETLWWSPGQEWRMRGEEVTVNSMRMVNRENLEKSAAEHRARKS